MRKNDCELIRRELEELMLGEAQSSAASQHLRECASCREFHERQTKLRQIVGSLGTVQAPADFDFRLRARLANQGNGMPAIYWPFSRRGLAVAAMVLMFATGAVVVRNVLNQPASVDQVARQPETHKAAVTPDQTPTVEITKNNPEPALADVIDEEAPTIRKSRRPQTDKKRTVSSMDFSSQRAEVISGAEPVGMSAAFPIDASLESFKVSLNDGHGNAKTISVPTITFGSQRIGQSGNQFASKRDW